MAAGAGNGELGLRGTGGEPDPGSTAITATNAAAVVPRSASEGSGPSAAGSKQQHRPDSAAIPPNRLTPFRTIGRTTTPATAIHAIDARPAIGGNHPR